MRHGRRMGMASMRQNRRWRGQECDQDDRNSQNALEMVPHSHCSSLP